MLNKKIYVIDDQCNGCGACKVVCPKHCISKGQPYRINQSSCIKCGRCTVRCRRKLIKLEVIEE